MHSGPGWRNADLRLRMESLHGNKEHLAGATINRAGCERSDRRRNSGGQQLRWVPIRDGIDQIGILLAFAYPDRVAQRSPRSEDGIVWPMGAACRSKVIRGCRRKRYLVVAASTAPATGRVSRRRPGASARS